MSDPEPAGCLGQLLALFGITPRVRGPQQREPLPYRRRDDFLSAAELSFYKVLLRAVGESITVCPKVRISDLLYVGKHPQQRSHQNRIHGRHVDFVLCDAASMQVLAVVELDDASHNRPQTQKRDKLVNGAFDAAGVPIVRIRARRSYVVSEVEAAVRPAIASAPDVAPTPALNSGGVPWCPKCDVPLKKRTAKQGPNAGGMFYGCPNYPRCKHTRPLD